MSIGRMTLTVALMNLVATGCGQSASYAVLGPDLLEVDTAPHGKLGGAIMEAATDLAKSVTTQPGSHYFPDLAQNSRWWGVKNKPDVVRSLTSFTDKSGRVVRIETISRRDVAVLVFIECEATGDPLVVLNQITKALEKAGVHASAAASGEKTSDKGRTKS